MRNTALRILLVGTLTAAFCFLVWQGRWLGILGWFLTVIFLIDHSARILFDLYEEDHHWPTGIIFWIASIFMGALGSQIVTRYGEIRRTRPTGRLASIFARLGARGLIIVENGVAVIMERSGRNTTIRGPGLYWTQRYEFIAQVIPLQPRLTERNVDSIQTADGMSISVNPLTVIYQVAQDFDPHTGRYVYSDADIRNLFYKGGHLYATKSGEPAKKEEPEEKEKAEDEKESTQRLIMPDEHIHRLVEQCLRNVLATRRLIDILTNEASSTRQKIVQETLDAAKPQAANYGVRIKTIYLGRIEVSREYRQFQASIVQQTTIQKISAGLQTALQNMLPSGALSLGQSLEQTQPQTAAILAAIVEQVLQRVVPLPPAPEGPTEDTGQTAASPPAARSSDKPQPRRRDQA